MAPPKTSKSGYLPGLDGLRALAILGVLAAHDLPVSIGPYSDARWKGYGGWGVYLFFAMSGVLICWRLLQDEFQAGKLRMGGFYLRRLFRIQPAQWAYLAVLSGMFLLGAVPAAWPEWRSALFSYTNFVVNLTTPVQAAAFLGHFWTLAVEEHFYLLISVVFLVPPRWRLAVLAGIFFALVLVQTLAERQGLYSVTVSERRTYWVIQYLLFPALLAMVVRHRAVRPWVERLLRPWVATLVILTAMAERILWRGTGIFLGLMRHFSLLSFISYSQSFFFYGLSVWVIAIMLHPRSWTTRILELRPLRFLGRLSYSVYLWHILFFVPTYLPGDIHSRLLLTLAERPWRYLATAAVAITSYYLVEKPMIRLGHRLAPPATAGHRDLRVDASGAREKTMIAAGTTV